MRVNARFVAHCESKPGPALKHEKQFRNFLVESIVGVPVYDNLGGPHNWTNYRNGTQQC